VHIGSRKSTIYDALCQAKFHIDHKCIMFTGKGEPNERTRGFVRLLDEKVDLPIYGVQPTKTLGLPQSKILA
jgi:DNA topoisomerase VI subunit A